MDSSFWAWRSCASIATYSVISRPTAANPVTWLSASLKIVLFPSDQPAAVVTSQNGAVMMFGRFRTRPRRFKLGPKVLALLWRNHLVEPVLPDNLFRLPTRQAQKVIVAERDQPVTVQHNGH